jgi:signal transduction histidine kinase
MASRLDTTHLFDLMRSATSIFEAADLEAILDRVVVTAVMTTGAKYGALGVIGGHGTLSEFHHRGMEPGTAARIGHLPVGRGVLGTLTRTGETLRLDEITSHPDSVGFPPDHPPMGAFLGVPIAVGPSMFGNLYLTEKPGGFTSEDERVIEGLAVLAGSAINTARLRSKVNDLAIVGERERIARDIHDSIIQDLFGMGLGLQGLSMRIDAPASHDLSRYVDQIDSVITRLRSLIFDLSHPGAEGESPRAAIRRLLDRLSEPFDTAITLNMSVDQFSETALTDEIRHIVQEAVSNALRHSGGKSVTVNIDAFPDSVLVTVADDGSGFDPDAVTRGLGLDNLEARLKRLDGELAIRSEDGKGTIVEARIPS